MRVGWIEKWTEVEESPTAASKGLSSHPFF